jgi:hypothetical protein
VIARSWALSLLVIAATGWESGCHHRHGSQALSAAAIEDSVMGTVSITGTSFEQRVVLRAAERSIGLVATSADSAALSRLGGTEIVARGTTQRDGLHVRAFTVLSVNGSPVADGTVHRDGTHLVLRRTNGDSPLGNPPAALDSLVGARIWISGPLDTGPNSYGVIEPPR